MRIYVDMDGVLCDYEKRHTLYSSEGMQWPQCQYGFFMGLEPMVGAIEAINLLSKSHDVWILTKPSVNNPLSYTEKMVWVLNYLGKHFVDRLILSPDKSLLRGDMLIDDNSTGAGQDRFVGEFIHFGQPNYPDWVTVLDYLKNHSS